MEESKKFWCDSAYQWKEIKDNANDGIRNSIFAFLKLVVDDFAKIEIDEQNRLSVYEDGYYLTMRNFFVEDGEILITWELTDGNVMESYLKDESDNIQWQIFTFIHINLGKGTPSAC